MFPTTRWPLRRGLPLPEPPALPRLRAAAAKPREPLERRPRLEPRGRGPTPEPTSYSGF